MNQFVIRNKSECYRNGKRRTYFSLYELIGGAYIHVWSGTVKGWNLSDKKSIERALEDF